MAPEEENTENPESPAEEPEAVEESPAEEAVPDEVALAADAAAEAPAEEPVAEEAPADESPAEEAPAEEPIAEEEVPDEVALAGDADTEAPEEPAAAEETVAETPAAEDGKKKDLPPGADLEPIALEPEAVLSAEEKARLEAEEEERVQREELVDQGRGEEPASRAPAKIETGARYLATGKRKRAIARVTLLPGDGKIVINQRTIEEYFPRPLHQTIARQPLTATGYEGNVDVRIRVHGGGIGGQAGAIRHGIARALTEVDPELRGDLKRRGFLTRDARVKERRKAGLKKARKKPQFSKR